ncbi:MAG: hypothetical protein IKT56_04895 [Clostridia bacterium]|nr:hypothetical protein [Clostridia bacterium]
MLANKQIFEKLAKPIEKGAWKWLLFAVFAVLGIIMMLGGGESKEQTQISDSTTDFERTVERIEEKIKALCERVEGAGSTSVVVTLGSPEEPIVSAGNFDENAYLSEICGIGIVCEGGSDPEVVHKLLNLVSAACNVQTNRIYIVGAQK